MAQNEIQKYTFSAVPSAGSWKPVYDSEPGTAVTDVSIAGDLALALVAISAISSGSNVSVSGNYTSGFTVEFVGALANTDMLTLSHQDNALTIPGGVTFGTTQEGGGGNNEVQTIVIDADGGTFTISIPGHGTTGSISATADGNDIRNAIEVATGAGTVSVSGGSGSYSFEFVGSLADTDIGQMSLGTSSLTKAVSISVSVLQEGVPVAVSLSSSSSTLAETGGTVEVYATSDAIHALDVTASLTFSGTAIKDTDYSSSADAIVISNGQTSGSITLTSIGDASVEGNESIVIDIDSVNNGTENGTQQITITLVDDDVTSTLTIAAFCEDTEMQAYQLNQTTSPLTFEMRSSSSGLLTTGLSPTVRLSKNGAAFATPAGTVGEMTLGWYSVAVSATDFNTLGSLNLLATAANCITTTKRMMVVGHSPTTGLPSIAPGLSGGMLVGSGTGTVVLTSGGSTYSVDAAGVNIATAASVPTLSGIASTVAASVPTNAQIASTVAANVPTNAQIAATVAANLPTNASIATTVAAVLPTNASIASTVASAITADHGSGSYTTANVSSLATTSQLASSSATILSAIPTLSGIASTIAASVPTNAQIAATVASAITADHGSGSYATADVSSLATTTQLASSSATLLAAIPSISTLATTSQLAASSAALLTQVNLAIATSAAILDDTGTSGVVVAAASKTGYALASDGLDSISTTAPSGVATNFRQMVVQTWRRLFKKATLTSTQLKTYADDGTTVVTTQAVTNSGGTETVGNAS